MGLSSLDDLGHCITERQNIAANQTPDLNQSTSGDGDSPQNFRQASLYDVFLCFTCFLRILVKPVASKHSPARMYPPVYSGTGRSLSSQVWYG